MSEITELHEPFMRWLKQEGILYRRSRSDRATSEACGEPDFLVLDRGRALAIEFKAPKTGKLSTAQLFRHAEYEKAGFHVFVLRDAQSAINVVNAWRSSFIGKSEPSRLDERLEKIGGAMWRTLENGRLERVRNA